MHILIVDDSSVWIKQGKALLEQAGYEVSGLIISEPEKFTSKSLSEAVTDMLKKTDVLLVDKDFGKGVTSTRLICVVRHNFPKLPIVRWTCGSDEKPYANYLGVKTINKPVKGRNEASFIRRFNEAVDEQKLILSGPMGIFAALDETAEPDKYAAEVRTKRLAQIALIARLANETIVDSGDSENPYFMVVTGKTGNWTLHELEHCICDGYLSVEDIRPYFSDLQKVIAKFKVDAEIVDYFKRCAEFIEAGNLDELELVQTINI